MCLAPARFLCQSAGDWTWSIALQLHAILVGERCWLVFSYHGELSSLWVSKYIKYSAHTGCISLCIYIGNIKSLLNVPKISHISRKIFQVSRFPAKSPDSRNKFVFLPKQPLLELSPPVNIHTLVKLTKRYKIYNLTLCPISNFVSHALFSSHFSFSSFPF